MAKYSDEQLSRILGEHASGHLKRGGSDNWGRSYEPPKCCVNQAAFNEFDIYVAEARKVHAAKWFDDHYRQEEFAPEALLEALAEA